jgi:hypothetical protein
VEPRRKCIKCFPVTGCYRGARPPRPATLSDARAFILHQPGHIQERGSWQHAAELMILAAERGGSIEAATTQIEDALFLEARYLRQWH